MISLFARLSAIFRESHTMTRNSLHLLAALSLVSFGLSGCGATSDRILKQSVGYECVGADSKVGGIICSENGQPLGQVSRYCYQTLGVTNCFDRPDPDRKNKPLGTPNY